MLKIDSCLIEREGLFMFLCVFEDIVMLMIFSFCFSSVIFRKSLDFELGNILLLLDLIVWIFILNVLFKFFCEKKKLIFNKNVY